jgi:5-formyltetrahydrofolate cyclo-ligase
VTPETPLFANRFGILEPAYSRDSVLQPSSDTLVVVPALAVDHQGVRLGYGGGYYDRYFGAFDTQKRPTLAAVVYKDFFVPRLPHEAHDLKVDFVVTEEGLFEVPRVL